MADAWGGAWGVSWGSAWGAGSSPPVPPPEVHQRGGGVRLSPQTARRLDDDAEQFEEARTRDRDARREAIERAFRKANGEPEPSEALPPIPSAAKQRKELARLIQNDLRLDGVSSSLNEIMRVLAAMEADAERQLEMEAEAVAVLMAII